MIQSKSWHVPKRHEIHDFACGLGCAEMMLAHAGIEWDQSTAQVLQSACWLTSPESLAHIINGILGNGSVSVQRFGGGNPAAGIDVTALVAGIIQGGPPVAIALRVGVHWVVCESLIWSSGADLLPTLHGVGCVDPEKVEPHEAPAYNWIDGQRFFHWTNEWLRLQVTAMSDLACDSNTSCEEVNQAVYAVSAPFAPQPFLVPADEFNPQAELLTEGQVRERFPAAISECLPELQKILEFTCSSVEISWSKSVDTYCQVAMKTNDQKELVVLCRRQVPSGQSALLFVLAGLRIRGAGTIPHWISNDPRDLIPLLRNKPEWMGDSEWDSLLSDLQSGGPDVESSLSWDADLAKNQLFAPRLVRTKRDDYYLSPSGKILRSRKHRGYKPFGGGTWVRRAPGVVCRRGDDASRL